MVPRPILISQTKVTMQEVQRPPEITMPERRTTARSDRLIWVLLVLIMLIGGYFRYVGLNWDDFTHLHPDERFLTDVAQGLGNELNPSGSAEDAAKQVKECSQRYPATAGKGPYFDTYCSALNPLNANSAHGLYVYGTLPLFIAKAAGEFTVAGANWYAHTILAPRDPTYANYDGSQWASYDGIQLVWRFLSALSEMGVILICFLIGLKLHDKWVGLLAAYLYAVTVFSIQMAHFGTVDAMANFFAALTILFAVLVQREGKLLHYALFGVFFGCAVASRINLVPLAALVALAGLVQILPAFETRLPRSEFTRALIYHGGGLILAAFLSLLCFRVFNPYAFNGPGFFGLSLNSRWLDNMNTAQALNAGAIDSPPNFQWVGRLPYLFPLNNMVLWGMGLPLGVAAWIAWLVAGYRILRSKSGAMQNLILVVWVLIYFGWLGRNWVMTMRYFLPAYSALVVLAAWGLIALIRAVRKRRWLKRIGVGLLVLVAASSLLWAAMFTNIYRHLLTRVAASDWVWEHVPGDFAMRVENSSDAAPIINIALDNNGLAGRHQYDVQHPTTTHIFTAPETGTVSAIYAYYMDDPLHDPGQEFLYFSITQSGVDKPLAEAFFSTDVTRANDNQPPKTYTIPFSEFTVVKGQQYTLNVQLIKGGPVIAGSFSIPIAPTTQSATPLINIPIQNNNFGASPDDLVSKVTHFDSFNPSATVRFTAPASGTVTSIYAPHLGDPNDDPGAESLHFTISSAGDGMTLVTGDLNANLARDPQHILGQSYTIPLDKPLTVEKGKQYDFKVDLLAGSVISGGSVFTWEGAWDDPIPYSVCALPNGLTVEDDPPPGLYSDARNCKRLDAWAGLINGYEQDIVYEDDTAKRDRLLMTLDNSDYIAISSNRFYDSLARNPSRWPLTNFYYQKLFAGELGYDLVATFQRTFQLGPIRISDQYLPTYKAPKWLNEFESEEAFSVYDHPVVFIFKKSDHYDAQKVHDLLFSVPLTRINDTSFFQNCGDILSMPCDPTIYNVATLSSDQAAKTPTELQFTQPMRQIQYDNGTWSQRFDQNSIVNNDQVAAVVVWWLTILLFGFAAFPLLFVLLPSFADRGYGLAKFAGMLLAGWGTWYLASFRIPVWSQSGIAGALVVIFLIGLALVWRVRAEFVAYLREHWRRLALIELITLIAFLIFVGVRLTNPDLWNPSFGGEKPMDFAYFNGVLRSTIFPPIDPWYAGGYINYYYFGYVIVGTPVLLLKMFPSIAYNLILPTLFSLTGIAAFSVAFNLVSAVRERGGGGETPPGKRRRRGNPWVAGVAALLLAVVLGNLDTPRVFLTGVAKAGGYVQPTGIQDYLVNQYTQEHGIPPDIKTMGDITNEAQHPSLSERVGYELSNSEAIVTSLANGFAKMLSGQEIYISSERWFWGPSRVLAETPGVEGNAITEMPIFTYIYGDMHAHMIAMPMQLAVVGLVLNEVLLAGSDQRRRWIRVVGLAMLGLYVGMLRATNTWDWITFTLLGGAGLVLAWWFKQVASDPLRSFFQRFTRRSLLALVGSVGGFVVFSLIAVIPYNYWFATSYNSIGLWQGGKTPLWGYFDIHGLFLFLVVSLLVLDTVHWFRGVYVRSLRGRWSWLVFGVMIAAGLLIGSLALALAAYQVTLVVVPLLVWIAVLFFRKGQSRPMQCVLLLAGLALSLTLGVEYVVLAGDIGRQNTVFKFYIQAWLLLSVAGGVAFAWLIAGVDFTKTALRGTWIFVLVLLVGIAGLFPLMAVRGKSVFRFDANCAPTTLDGMDYMKCAKQFEGDPDIMNANPSLVPFPLSEDYAMIRWLQQNVQGTPVIMEGQSEGSLYKWNGRISIYTGLPQVIGWNWHQKQQRTFELMGQWVDMRIANVNAFYETTSIGTAWDILRFYDVRYVIVGGLEHAYYKQSGLSKFDNMVQAGLLKVVFRQGNSVIYRVNTNVQLVDRG